MQNRDYANAERIYARLATLEPKIPEIYSNLGLARYFQHKLGSAEVAFQGALRLNAYLFTANFFLAKIYFERECNADALRLVERAVGAHPRDKAARLLLAAVLVGLKSDDQAIVQYREVLKENPGDVETLYDLGLVYLDQGRQAFQHLRNFQDTDFPSLVLAEFDAERPGFQDAAIAEYRKAISLSPQVPELRIGLGNLLLKTGNWQAAEEVFRKELTVDPFSYKAFLGLAKVALLKGSLNSAVIYLTQHS